MTTNISRRALLLGLAGAAVASQLAACGSDDADQPAEIVAKGVARAQPASNAPVAATVAGMAAFGHRLLLANPPAATNWISSPLSIASVFAMARVGARGTTASQLDQVFGFPSTGRDDAFNAIDRALDTVDVPKPAPKKPSLDAPPTAPVLSLGNALFLQDGTRVGDAFLHTLAAEYGTGARIVDFRSTKANDQINAWVRRQTANRIDRLFDHLDASTELVLANAVYLRAEWQQQFLPDETAPEPFTGADGSTRMVRMMRLTGRVRYASGTGFTAIELPYAKSDLAMRIILPGLGAAPGTALSPGILAAVDAGLTNTQVGVNVPRWDFATDIDLGKALPTLGLTAPFGVEADFSGIAPGLFVSQAVHRANITVGEWGTEAAAATGAAMAQSAPAPPSVTFLANRPFAFVIVSRTTRTPLFMGTVAAPTPY